MDKVGNNYYQTCRICAGLTQGEASEVLEVSLSQLQKVETDQRVPSDDLVNMMADVYQAPLLAWWHLKKHNPLGHHLPEVSLPQTNCDMAFQSILMVDDLDKANILIKELLADGIITPCELEKFEQYKKLIKTITDKGASIQVFAKSVDEGSH